MDDTGSVDRLGLEVLTPDDCWELLDRAPVGRLAFVEGGAPTVLPVTHAVVGRRIVFKSPPGGKLGAAIVASAVAFEVDDWDVESRSGWSVVVRGVAEASPEDAPDLDGLGLVPWLESATYGTWIEIRADEVTGRRLGSDAG